MAAATDGTTRARGTSTPGPTTWSGSATLGITSPIVLGNSWGGTVAMHCAARHADHPSKLVVSSCSARRDIRRKVEAFRRLHGDEVAAIAEGYWTDPDQYRLRYREVCLPLYTVNRHPIGATSIMNTEVTTHFINEERSLDLLAELGSVKCEVLAGEQDPVCPIEDALDIVSALPENLVRFERLAECGHGCFRDQPKSTEAIVREFLVPS